MNFFTQCAAILTVGVSDVFIAFITEVPILHLGEVLYLKYYVAPGNNLAKPWLTSVIKWEQVYPGGKLPSCRSYIFYDDVSNYIDDALYAVESSSD